MSGKTNLSGTAKNVRLKMIRAIRILATHHIGCSFGIVEILTYLYFERLKLDASSPKDPERDHFLLSKGHAALALYAVLCEKGFFSEEVLMTYDKDGGRMPEHASTLVPGVELSTGSLGHALPVGNGLATSFRDNGKSNKVYVLLSDGELDEGSNWEGFMFAGHHKLSNLTVIVDRNGFQGYAETEKVIDLSPIADKIRLFGWEVTECDGHDFVSIGKAFDSVENSGKPRMIIAKTVKGKGIPYFEGRFDSHYKSIDEETKRKILEEFVSKG